MRLPLHPYIKCKKINEKLTICIKTWGYVPFNIYFFIITFTSNERIGFFNKYKMKEILLKKTLKTVLIKF